MRWCVYVLLAMSLAACGSKSAQQATSNPAVQKTATKTEALVQKCMSAQPDLISRSGRKAFVSCVAPGGDVKKIETCAERDISHDGIFTKGERTRFAQDFAGCLP